jgi:hypothetical protein
MNEKEPVSFPDWKAALAQSGLSPEAQASHSHEILSLLHHCKKTRSPVTVVLIKQWLAGREKAATGPAHVALRWFYREAAKADSENRNGAERNPRAEAEMRSASRSASGGRAPPEVDSVLGASHHSSRSRSYNQRPPWRPMEPRPAAQDLGGPDWEKALVGTLRVRGLLARTEDTYRSWAAYRLRHAAFAVTVS